jgi:uncharacterized protein
VTWLQHWTDVLFLHYPVAPNGIAANLPAALEPDTAGGRAWLSFVFFRLRLRPAGLPFVPGFSSLLELNIRTYVRHRGRSGIYFLNMYADNRLAIFASRCLTPLRYELARMGAEQAGKAHRRLTCKTKSTQAARISADYEQPSTVTQACPGSLDAWLLERYRLYVESPNGAILLGVVDHLPWTAAAVEAADVKHELPALNHLALDQSPALAHHSPGVAATFHAFRPALVRHPSTFILDRSPRRRGVARGEPAF